MERLIFCRACGNQFSISQGEQDLYTKIGMPPPRDCFFCRAQKTFAHWTFGKFRKGASDLSGKSLITALPEKPRYPIYTAQEWFSDAWDPMDHGVAYDPARPFLDQFAELQTKVPRPHQAGSGNTNSDWSTDSWNCKDCYLSRSILNSENLSYCYRTFNSKDSLDLTYCYDSEKSYDLIYSFNCFKTFYAFNCRNIIESSFLFDCRNVQNSFMCWNLRDKQYHILNQPYSKEEYHKKIKEYDLGSRKAVTELKAEFWQIVRERAFHRSDFNVNVSDSTGDYLTDCKNCTNCFFIESSQDCYNCMRGIKQKSCIDMVGSGDAELCGMLNAGFPNVYASKYSSWLQNCRYMEYSELCNDCEYCFGCIGLRKKKFCILNTQYSEGEYRDLKKKIIAAMEKEGMYGDFFPYHLADAGYNVSTAQIYFPLTKEEALRIGAVWDEPARGSAQDMSPDDLPDNIRDADAAVTAKPLMCPETGWRFNIAPRELAFLKEMGIALPRTHFDHRTIERLNLLAVLRPVPYTCVLCTKDVTAYYPREWGYEKVVCGECYKREIV